jgi:hypothetical protein
MIHKDMIQKFLAITVDDFFGVNIKFSLRSLRINEQRFDKFFLLKLRVLDIS